MVINISMFLDNRYTTIYNQIMDRAKERTLDGYSENHHIVPKSMGGDNTKENMARLTAREHYIAHHLLTKMTEGINKSKMWCAFRCFNIKSKNQDRKKMSAKLYEKASIEQAKYCSKLFKGKKGTPKTEEQKRRASESQKGMKGHSQSQATREKISRARKGKPTWNKGKTLSEEHKQKIRESMKHR